MKCSYLLSFAFLLLINVCYSQSFGKNTISNYTNEAISVEADAVGNTYVLGYFSGKISFSGSHIIPNTNGSSDVYLVKYDPSGSVLWVKSFGGSLSDRPSDMTLSSDNHLLITGQFFNTISFGTFNLTSSGSKDIFISKIDLSGNVVWAYRKVVQMLKTPMVLLRIYKTMYYLPVNIKEQLPLQDKLYRVYQMKFPD